MPIQILPEQIPSPLTRLLTGLGTGIESGLQQKILKSQQKKSAMSLGKVLGLEDQELEAFSQLEPEQQKLASDVIKQREKSVKQFITPERKESIQNVISRQIEILKGGATGTPGLGTVRKIFSEKTREARSEFDQLSSSIEATLVPLISRGALSKPRFDYLMTLLPKSSDTDATLRGKFKGLSLEFGLPVPEFGKHKEVSKKSLEDIFK